MAEQAVRGLSKSRFLVGSQCHRLLWWSVHEREAPERVHGPATELIFAQGHLVGEEARRRFPGGVLVDLPAPHELDLEARIARTQELILAGEAVIFEAAFQHEGVFVAVDVLERGAGGGWHLIEVKSTTKVKDEHILDVALQRHVLRGCGLEVARSSVMHLNRDCVLSAADNEVGTAPGELFALVDVSAEAAVLEASVAQEAQAQRVMLGGEIPAVPVGAHCAQPRPCAFFERCHAALPEHHVSTLYAVGGAKAQRLVEQGFHTLHDLDDTVELPTIAQRQVRAVQAGATVVEAGLGRALHRVGGGPIGFLDLETVAFAIPRFVGCRPWGAVAAQASIHVRSRRGAVAHHAWLADGPGDPRRELGQFVVEKLAGARTVLAWNAGFEQRCLEQIARAFPELKAGLDDVIARLVDLLPIVRRHVYHPGFGGSFSLKHVAPALVPELSYDGLAVHAGMDASAALFGLLTEPRPDGLQDPAERTQTRESLLAYCGHDTQALVDILAVLRQLASQPRAKQAAAVATRHAHSDSRVETSA
ncbi:MAG: DUF2779 domain-containing protein [Deltaproteobacteria bacterium]|nr:DUF2779 domain-containing protein [Deltaproteobacteria bacterium]